MTQDFGPSTQREGSRDDLEETNTSGQLFCLKNIWYNYFSEFH